LLFWFYCTIGATLVAFYKLDEFAHSNEFAVYPHIEIVTFAEGRSIRYRVEDKSSIQAHVFPRFHPTYIKSKVHVETGLDA
jgi:hypothetical protein